MPLSALVSAELVSSSEAPFLLVCYQTGPDPVDSSALLSVGKQVREELILGRMQGSGWVSDAASGGSQFSFAV